MSQNVIDHWNERFAEAHGTGDHRKYVSALYDQCRSIVAKAERSGHADAWWFFSERLHDVAMEMGKRYEE